jgi:hypothetical protein
LHLESWPIIKSIFSYAVFHYASSHFPIVFRNASAR